MHKNLNFYIRTEGGSLSGLGHVFRSLALASKIEEGFKIKPIFLFSGEDRVKRIIEKAGFPVRRVSGREKRIILSRLKENFLPVFIVDLPRIDGYKNPGLKNKGILVIIVNERIYSPPGDMIIDVAGYSGLKTASNRPVLSGPSYQILRDEFLFYRKRYNVKKDLKNVLVTFGGSDPYGVTLKILKMIPNLPEKLFFTLIIGPAFRGERDLNIKRKNVEIISASGDMARLMGEFDLAICGFGITSYELACLGVPALIVGQVEREKASIGRFCRASGAINLGMHTRLKEEDIKKAIDGLREFSVRKKMWQRSRSLVDGKGAERAVKAIFSLIKK